MGMMSFNKMRRQNADKAEEPKEAKNPQKKKADEAEEPKEETPSPLN